MYQLIIFSVVVALLLYYLSYIIKTWDGVKKRWKYMSKIPGIPPHPLWGNVHTVRDIPPHPLRGNARIIRDAPIVK